MLTKNKLIDMYSLISARDIPGKYYPTNDSIDKLLDLYGNKCLVKFEIAYDDEDKYPAIDAIWANVINFDKDNTILICRVKTFSNSARYHGLLMGAELKVSYNQVSDITWPD